MSPFPKSCSCEYILAIVDYIYKWVEEIATQTNDVKVVIQILKKNIFIIFGTPIAIIFDGVKHYINWQFQSLLGKCGVTNNIGTMYHAQISGQVEVSNKKLKRILEKNVSLSKKD